MILLLLLNYRTWQLKDLCYELTAPITDITVIDQVSRKPRHVLLLSLLVAAAAQLSAA